MGSYNQRFINSVHIPHIRFILRSIEAERIMHLDKRVATHSIIFAPG